MDMKRLHLRMIDPLVPTFDDYTVSMDVVPLAICFILFTAEIFRCTNLTAFKYLIIPNWIPNDGLELSAVEVTVKDSIIVDTKMIPYGFKSYADE